MTQVIWIIVLNVGRLFECWCNLGSGAVRVGGEEVGRLNLASLRSRLAVVPQEPTLFNRTIAANIQYGDNSRDVTMEEV